ncbi:MAG: hypothetical protein JXA03_16925 [Bacteroidales bacterium]|nr:hypothetical protein [Bacteroidales bacterium]
MERLIVHLDKNSDKSKVIQVLKMVKGVLKVSDRISKSDFEILADDILITEMKKADKTPLLSYSDGMNEFKRIKKGLKK